MTQEELASIVGVARTSITNLEIGKQHLPLHHLMTVAEALDAQLLELIPSEAELLAKVLPSRRLALMKGGPRTEKFVADLLAQTR